MKLLTALVAVFVSLPAAAQSPAGSTAPALVFRDPFTLKLRIDPGKQYVEQFGKIPYVADNVVYLFSGETFGINVTVTGDEITGITYQKNPGKADVVFKFTQEKAPRGHMMMLTIKNNLRRRLYLDALMTVPEHKGAHKTSIIPVEAGLTNFESWPHPIIQLALRDFRFSGKPAQ